MISCLGSRKTCCFRSCCSAPVCLFFRRRPRPLRCVRIAFKQTLSPLPPQTAGLKSCLRDSPPPVFTFAFGLFILIKPWMLVFPFQTLPSARGVCAGGALPPLPFLPLSRLFPLIRLMPRENRNSGERGLGGPLLPTGRVGERETRTRTRCRAMPAVRGRVHPMHPIALRRPFVHGLC